MSSATIRAASIDGTDLIELVQNLGQPRVLPTVTRGNIKEDIFTSQAAIDAAKADKPLPSGSVITLVDYRDGKLFRYVVMEKRTGLGRGLRSGKTRGRMCFVQ